ncbi:MAG: SUMF1/EgtB/PvdO family nonheme iron enzyme [Cytophagales bacterium]|nr:SUMF1/EgtB/PvdO family nonheme iron enzyme [Cytophagales bacterium]
MPSNRQLAAIMFVDMVGYTSMMQRDEHRSIVLRDKLRNTLEKEAKTHSGQIIKYTGDGALCSFSSAAESVRAAIAVQLFMQQEPIVPLRIGIHQADVVFEDGDVVGDGVNIASRMESLATPGSIFISAKVYDDVKNQKDIETISLGKYSLKNIMEPVEIFAVCNSGLQVPRRKKLEGKGVKYISQKFSVRKKTLAIGSVSAILLIAITAYFIIPPTIKKQRARAQLLPAIQKLVDDNFRPPTEAYDLALEAEKYIPTDSSLINLWPVVSSSVSIVTEPPGAEVLWKDYHTPQAEWRVAGTTPLKDVKFPRGYLRMEIRKQGYQTIEYAGPMAYQRIGREIDSLSLDATGSLPINMVRIPSGITRLEIVGLEQHGGKDVNEFLIDKYEVTNKQFKVFMDAGGYTNSAFWDLPISANGWRVTLSEALKLFIDKTGRPGPATWEAGSYPDGQEDHPVAGVSWYEAMAYASFSGKRLPTIFHWGRVAETSRTEFIVPLSNFSGKSTAAVGSLPAYQSFGIYDLAGNAREWCSNSTSDPQFRYILGGGWNDPRYSFNDAYTQNALDRSITNGFRCMKELPGDSSTAHLAKSVSMAYRDYRKEKPVDDKTFEIFKRQYAYDKLPLNAKVDSVVDAEFWTIEKVSFDAGSNKERMVVYIYKPKSSQGPLQSVLYFPGSGDIFSRRYNPESIGNIDFILKNGRALIRPIYKGTHERFDELDSDLPDETVFYKDHMIMWRKEIGRTLDYLETRNDFQNDKIGFLGWSWGGYMGGIMPALEPRIKVVVLNVGGMVMQKSLPEVDQLNFLPRVTQPVLMLNGKHDMFFPIETSQKPMFDFLGTPKDKKKMIVYESGHLVPRTDFVRESLNWFDQYLGPAK